MRREVLLAAVVLVFLVVLPAAHAGTYDVINEEDVLIPFRTNNQGNCIIDGSVTPNDVQFTNLPWPTPGDVCGSLLNAEIAYKRFATREIIIDAADSYDSTTRAEFTGFSSVRICPPNFSCETFNTLHTRSVATTLYNRVPSTSFIIQDLLWCGEEFNAQFAKTTLSPTYELNEPLLKADNYRSCGSMWRSQVNAKYQGDPDTRSENAFFSTHRNVNTPFSFPLPVQCEGYDVQVYYRSEGSWGIEQKPMQVSVRDGNGNPIEYRYVQDHPDLHDKNDIEVTLTLQSGNVKTIAYRLDHGAPDGGGIGVRVHCKNPIDPDTSQSVCESAGFTWSTTVNAAPQNNPRQACCGDDGNADNGDKVGSYTCTRSGTTWTWVQQSAQCINDNCCLSPVNGESNESHVLVVNGVQHMCMNAGGWGWNDAAVETASFILKAGTPANFSVTSDGTEWVVCGDTDSTGTKQVQGALIQGDVAYPVAPSNQAGLQNNECGTARYCDNCYEAGACVFDPDSSECQACIEQADTCNANRYDCSAIHRELLCQNNACLCDEGLVWDGTQCDAPACPATYTYSATSGLCEPQGSGGSVPATVNLVVKNVCSLLHNTKQLKLDGTPLQEHVCVTEWKPRGTYGLREEPANSGTYVSVDMGQSEYVCRDGAREVSIATPAQDRSAQYPCGDNQCYFNPNTNTQLIPPTVREHFNSRSRCVDDGEWVLDYYCDAGDWTTRTTLLADALLSLKSDNYVLQCDSYNESLNSYAYSSTKQDPKGFATISGGTPSVPVPLVNGFCSISDLGRPTNNVIAVGTTINGHQGASLGFLDASSDNDPLMNGLGTGTVTFPAIINDARLNAEGCTNIATLTPAERAVDAFVACESVAGTTFYNPKTSVLVFMANDAATLNTNYGAFQNLMQTNVPTIPTPLVGLKLYAAKRNQEAIAGVLQFEGSVGVAKRTATISYAGMDVTNHYMTRTGRQATWNFAPGTTTQIVRVPFATSGLGFMQQHWEYFTLALRP